MRRLSHPALLLSVGLIFLAVTAFFLIPMEGPVHAQSGPSLNVVAPASVNRCAAFEVTLNADFSPNQGGGWETDLGYDNTRLLYDKVTTTTFLSNGGTRDVGDLGPLASSGLISLGQYSYKTTEGVTGAGDVASIRFWATGAGAANFTLSQAQFADPAANGTTPAMNGATTQINDVANCSPFVEYSGGQSAQTSEPTNPQWFTITTYYRDLDGVDNLKAVYLQLRNPNNGIRPIFSQYWLENNKLYIFDENTRKWKGGRTISSNEQSVFGIWAIINTRETNAVVDPETKTLTVNWTIMLRSGLIPDARYYKRQFARDMNLSTSGWVGGLGYVDVTN